MPEQSPRTNVRVILRGVEGSSQQNNSSDYSLDVGLFTARRGQGIQSHAQEAGTLVAGHKLRPFNGKERAYLTSFFGLMTLNV